MSEERERSRIAITVPEKHFPKWLQKQSHITELKIWIGFAKFVLFLATIAGLTIYISNKSIEALKDLLPIIGAICSLAGVAVAVNKHINRNRHSDD